MTIMSRDRHLKETRKVDSLLFDDTSTLQNLVKRAQTIQQLGQKLQSLLDPCYKNRFTLANINNEVVTLQTDSSAWATRLRYQIPQILNILNQELGQKNIRTVRIKVKPLNQDKIEVPKRKQQISPETSNFLKQTAESFTDSQLRDSLLRIARHHSDED